MPNDTKLKLQFMRLGADVERITHEQTDLGDTTVVVYELEIADATAQGEAIFVEVRGLSVSVTITAYDRDTTEDVADRIVDTLAGAGVDRHLFFPS